MESEPDITTLLHAWQRGDDHAYERLIEITYEHLRTLSRQMLRQDRQRQLIQPTELVHECALRLVNLDAMRWEDRSHFFALASVTMRRVLVDQARRYQAEKRAGIELTLATEHLGGEGTEQLDLLALDEALLRLSRLSAEKAKIIELKFFGGLSNEEAALVLDISPSTVKRQWSAARIWLFDQLNRQ